MFIGIIIGIVIGAIFSATIIKYAKKAKATGEEIVKDLKQDASNLNKKP